MAVPPRHHCASSRAAQRVRVIVRETNSASSEGVEVRRKEAARRILKAKLVEARIVCDDKDGHFRGRRLERRCGARCALPCNCC